MPSDGGEKKEGRGKTAWLKSQLSSRQRSKHTSGQPISLDKSQHEYRPSLRHEIPPPLDVHGSQIHSSPPLPPEQGPAYDKDGNYTGASYVYNPKSKQLDRRLNEAHTSTSHRDCSSFDSTNAQTGTSWIEESDPHSSSPMTTVSRRPLSILPDFRLEPTHAKIEDSGNADRLQQLSHIERKVFGAMRKNRELEGPEHESAEDAIDRIIDQYEKLASSLNNSESPPEYLNTQRTNFIKERDELRAANTNLHESNSRLRDENNRLQENNSGLRNDNIRFQDMHGKLQENHNQLQLAHIQWQESHKMLQDRNSLLQEDATALQGSNNRLLDKIMMMDQKYKELEFQKNEMASSHGARLQKDQNSRKREMENLIKTYQDQSRKSQRDYDLSMTGWNQKFKALEEIRMDLDARLSNARADADERVRETEDKWERRIQRERRDQQERVKNLESEIEQLKVSLQNERSHRHKELVTQKKELLEKHEVEKVELRTVIEDFKVATSRREHFKGLTDSELAGLFKRLANSIEDFSRLEWDFSKEQQWPLTDTRMREMGKNTRKLKQQVIQHTLWLFLRDYVFGSPFRIFGQHGHEFDVQWTQIYASGVSSFDWPEVSSDTERSRFETAKAFMDAVEPSARDSAIKQSFEASLDLATRAIFNALATVVTVSANNRKSLDSIVRSAAKTWLESCSQRFRLVMICEGSGHILSNGVTPESTINHLMLVVRPDLKRYGDSQGKDLMRGEPLAGWKGSVEAYP